jgi:aryl-alcohol dehydrogenase-like predicted oxidoreductase
MRFGEPLDDARLEALLAPGDGIDTVITADAYGAGEADTLLGRALQGVDREDYCLVGAIGHDFYTGEREGAKGYPRFTDSRLRGERKYADYIRMATERSLQRIGVERFDLLLLHNPDRVGYTSEAVWLEGMAGVHAAGLTRTIGLAPGPANGFTLDVIGCIERYGELIDWAMIILNPLEPWPGELVLAAARANDVELIARVVDYGGLFHDDVLPGHEFAEHDHRLHRPDGWIEAGRERLERMRPIAARHGLSMLQLACAWDLAQAPVRCVAPTLIQEPGTGGGPIKSIEDKRAELAAVGALVAGGAAGAAGAPGGAGGPGGAGADSPLSAQEVRAIREIGDNTGCMALKGANPAHEGPARADRWGMDGELESVAGRWDIDPARDLGRTEARV